MLEAWEGMKPYTGRLPGYAKDWSDLEKQAYIDADIRLYYFHQKYNHELQLQLEKEFNA